MSKSNTINPKASHDGDRVAINHSYFSPTPNNTFRSSGDSADDTVSQLPRSSLYNTTSSGMMFDPHLGHDMPAPLPGSTPQSSIRRTSFSSHASSYLLPSPSLTMSRASDIPFSTRPIPSPLQTIQLDETMSHPSSHLNLGITTTNRTSDHISTPLAVKFGTCLKDTESRGLASQEDIDAHRLRSLGYDAVLGRDYTFWSSFAISWLNIGALQGTISAVSTTYSYGGPMMILVAWPVSGIFVFFMTLTLSELASAYPVSGAMASWSWKAARGGVGGERGWTWLVTGFVMGGHVGNILLVTWEIANIVVGTIGLAVTFERKTWYNFLLFLGVLFLVGSVASTRWGQSHRFWLFSGAFGLAMWLVLCVTLLATNVTRFDAGNVITTYYNTTGWSSKPYVYILGWQYTSIASGADASAHMAEETQDPSRNVPNAMTASVIGTYVLGYISIILLLLSISPEDASTVKSHSFAFGYILTKVISESGAISICCLMIVVMLLQVLAQLQASSRFVFAIARENGIPLSSVFKRTNAHKRPVFAVWLVIALCVPFACLTLASANTLYSVLAVTACTMSYVGYAIPVALYLVSKIDLQTEGRSSWSLRKWSKPVAVIGLLYALLVVITQTFPGSKPVQASTMSWSPVIIVGTGVICYVTWRCYGDKHFAGPIRAITKWESGVEIDLSTTLASSRTRNSHSGSPLGENATSGSLKTSLSPYHPSGREGVTDVTVQSAEGTGIGSDGQWTNGTDSGVTISTVTAPSDGKASAGRPNG